MVQGKTENSLVFLFKVVVLISMLHIRYPASRMDFTELLENVWMFRGIDHLVKDYLNGLSIECTDHILFLPLYLYQHFLRYAGNISIHSFYSWRRKWQSTPVFLPGKSHGQRRLAGYSPWGPKESDMTEHAHTTAHAYLVTSRIHTDPHIHTHKATPWSYLPPAQQMTSSYLPDPPHLVRRKGSTGELSPEE